MIPWYWVLVIVLSVVLLVAVGLIAWFHVFMTNLDKALGYDIVVKKRRR